MIGGIRGDQSISFQLMQRQVRSSSSNILRDDPAVDSVVVFTGGGGAARRLHVRHAEAAGRAQDRRPTR